MMPRDDLNPNLSRPRSILQTRSVYWRWLVSIIVLMIPMTLFAVDPLVEKSRHPFGYTAGELAVNENGAALYSIPITIAPGTAGLAPELALTYNSQAGNGLLGIGWSLSGLSVISRCPATRSQDGAADGIELDGGDRFCLDGERLMAISGADGDPGTEYRTEQDTFRRVFSHGTAGSGPASWTVETRSGLRFEYGTSEDSRIELPGHADALFWNVHRILDSVGNYLEVTYEEDDTVGEYHPVLIRYTGNEAMEVEPYASIELVYEDRPDVRQRHVAGAAMTVSQRLAEMVARDGDSVYRRYVLDYETGSAGTSRLTTLTECGSDGICFEPTTFGWTDGANAFEDEAYVGERINNIAGSGWYRWVLDMTGDGLPDYIFMASGTRNLYVRKNIGGELAPEELWGNLAHNFYGDEQLFTDLDGDGFLDYVYRRYPTPELWALRNTGTGFEPANLWGTRLNRSQNSATVWLEDVDADGLSDYLYQRYGTREFWWKPGNGQSFGNDDYLGSADRGVHEQWIFDIDRDLLPDLVYRVGKDFYVKRGNGKSLEAEELWGQRAYNHQDSWNIDLDGDGLTDHVYRRAATWDYYVMPNTGNGFGTERMLGTATGGINLNGALQWPVDMTGDGLMDLVYNRYGTYDLYVMAYDGNGFGPPVFWGVPQTLRHYYHNWVLDMTGDGKADYYFMDLKSSREYLLKNGGPVPDLLSEITEGNGRLTTIEMKPLTDASVYRKGNSAEFPNLDFQAPIHVVAAYSMDDGIGGKQRYGRHYAEAQANLHGRGFRGFLETTVIDEQTGIRTTVFYERDYRCISSKILWTEQRLSDGTLIRETDNDITIQDHGSGVHFSYVRESTTKSYDLDGTLLSTTITASDYDQKGNLLSTVVDHGDGHVETTVNTYDDDLDEWWLGRLVRTETTRTAPSQPDVTRVSSFAYDPENGLLIEEVTEPDRPWMKLVKTYTHDAFGNIETSTLSAAGYQPRVHTTSFDDRGRYHVETINAAGHGELSAYHLGLRVAHTGPNGLTTTWQRDGFGRVVKETRPDGTFTNTFIFACEDGDGCPTRAVYFMETATPGKPESTTFLDLHDREVRQQVIGFDGTPIRRDTFYDDKGRVAKVSEPYLEGEIPLWTVYTYDDLGRIVEEQAPGNRVIKTDYDGLTTRITNPLGHEATRRVDVRGRLIESIDALENPVRYTYDAFGNLVQVEDPYGNLTVMTYDERGRRVLLEDPDTGLTIFDYNPFDEVIAQTDALGQTTSFTYDLLGRLANRREPEGESTWIYDQLPMGIGQLGRAVGPDGARQDFFFDGFGRPKETRTTIGGQVFSIGTTYDFEGRVDSVVYPSGLAVRNIYNIHGHPQELRSADGTLIYWRAEAVNARGQLERASLGNGLVTERIYDPETGLLEEVSTGAVQNLAFAYDLVGNLLERNDLLKGLTEVFHHDRLQRLESARVLGHDEVYISYDALGNIRYKSDVGGYDYGEGGAGPHAVTSVSGEIDQSYTYDAVGNRISSSDGTVSYTSFDKPRRIVQEGLVLTLKYGPDRRLYRQVEEKDGLTTTKWYVGDLFERHQGAFGTKDLHYLRAGGEVVAVHVNESGQQDRTLYLHRDHLGSVQTITDAAGSAVEVLSYDAWGRRRDASTWDQRPTGVIFTANFESGNLSGWGIGAKSATPKSCLSRGFTGHEHLDSVGLIHMGGRVYDPVIGRFLSADPFVQAPDFSQSLNRYSYVLNNPLSLTDPSGFFFKKLFKAIGKFFKSVASFVVKNLPAVISLGVGLLTGGVLLPALLPSLAGSFIGSVLSGAAMGFITSFTGALLGGADLGTALSMGLMSAVISGITAGLTTGVGDLFAETARFVSSEANALAKALAHGTVQGLSNELRGGKFEHGFLSAAFSSIAAPFVDFFNTAVERVLAAAVIGGTAAELGGGKFANGAATGAFVRLLNDEHHLNEGDEKSEEVIEEGQNSNPLYGFNPEIPHVMGPLKPPGLPPSPPPAEPLAWRCTVRPLSCEGCIGFEVKCSF